MYREDHPPDSAGWAVMVAAPGQGKNGPGGMKVGSPSLLVPRSCGGKKVGQREPCGADLPFLNFRPAGEMCYSS